MEPLASGEFVVTIISQRKLLLPRQTKVCNPFFKKRETLSTLNNNNDVSSTNMKFFVRNKNPVSQNTTNKEDKTTEICPKKLFNQGATRSASVFPAALHKTSRDKIANKTECEDDTPKRKKDKYFFGPNTNPARRSTNKSRRVRVAIPELSPILDVTSDIEKDFCKMLPSSTMVEQQLAADMTACCLSQDVDDEELQTENQVFEEEEDDEEQNESNIIIISSSSSSVEEEENIQNENQEFEDQEDDEEQKYSQFKEEEEEEDIQNENQDFEEQDDDEQQNKSQIVEEENESKTFQLVSIQCFLT